MHIRIKLNGGGDAMQPNFYAGKYTFFDEVLFECSFSDLLGIEAEDIEAGDALSCCLYDIGFHSAEDHDSIEQTMAYSLEIFCDVRHKYQQHSGIVSRKINGEKKLLIPKKEIEGLTAAESENHSIINHISNTAFHTRNLKNGDIYLAVTANIEIMILDEPHEDFWICSRTDIVPPAENEVHDWKKLIKDISIRDTVLLFENLIQLIKENVCSGPDDDAGTDKKKLEQENLLLKYELNELRNRILALSSRISERDYIIDGLLKIIKPL